MKVTKYHHKNSQLHMIPNQSGHKLEVTCLCGPRLKMHNGHIIVDHRSGPGFRGKWRGEVANYGTKLLDAKGVPL